MVSRGCTAILAIAGVSILSACSQFHFAEHSSAALAAGEATGFEKAYGAGKQQMAFNRLGLAIVQFERALAHDPRSVRALNALGACYDDLHRYDIAMGFYDRALAIEPLNGDTLNNMAVSLAMAGYPTDAQVMIGKAASIDPANETIRLNMASMSNPAVARAVAQSAETPAAIEADDQDRPKVERTGVQAYAVFVRTATSPIRSGAPPPPKANKPVRHASAVGTRASSPRTPVVLLRAGHRHSLRIVHRSAGVFSSSGGAKERF